MPNTIKTSEQEDVKFTFKKVEETENSFVAIHYTHDGTKRETYFVAISEEQFERAVGSNSEESLTEGIGR